jgi:hypothetical protein
MSNELEQIVQEEVSLEILLLALTKFGLPRLSMMTDGWYCEVGMNTNSDGVSFTVKSDFYLATPRMAVMQCSSRIDQAIKTITDIKK